MKKAKLLLISSIPAFLFSCSKDGKKTFPTGEKIEEKDAVAVLNKAGDALKDEDAIGFELDASLTASTKVETSYHGQKYTTTSDYSAELNAKAALKGLQEEKAKDLSASLIITGKASGKANASGLSSEMVADGSLDTKAYIQENYAYLDLSNNYFYDLWIAGTSGASQAKSKKIKTPLFSEGDSNPVKGIFEEADWNEAVEDIKESSKEFEALKTSDGNYAYVFTIDPTKVDASMEGEMKASLTFDENGFKYIYTEFDLTEVMQTSTTDGSYSSSVSYAYKGNISLSFLFGKEVTVENVEDVSSFTTQEAVGF